MDKNQPKDWRELCKAAANELDPEKLMHLIGELTRALDQRNRPSDSGAGIANQKDGERTGFQSQPA